MSKIVKTIDLTKGELSDFIKNLKSVSADAEKVNKGIINELKTEGKSEINKSIASSEYEASEKTTVFESTIEKKEVIGIQGTQALYDEFGTGTIGANNPHEVKGEFTDLEPYNSGKKIRPNTNPNSNASLNGIPVNGMYWTYKIGERVIYTQGRPAGMHVYKARKKIKSKISKLTEKRVGEWLSKL